MGEEPGKRYVMYMAGDDSWRIIGELAEVSCTPPGDDLGATAPYCDRIAAGAEAKLELRVIVDPETADALRGLVGSLSERRALAFGAGERRLARAADRSRRNVPKRYRHGRTQRTRGRR